MTARPADTILDAFRSLNQTYGITIVVVTHDMSITQKVDRVVTIRDGRSSLEAVRVRTFRPPPEPADVLDEYVVIDRAGRLQLPSEFVRKLDLNERVKVQLEEDRLTISPERGGEETR